MHANIGQRRFLDIRLMKLFGVTWAWKLTCIEGVVGRGNLRSICMVVVMRELDSCLSLDQDWVVDSHMNLLSAAGVYETNF